MKSFDKMTVAELKEKAKELDLKDYEKLKKAELLALVTEKASEDKKPAKNITIKKNITKKPMDKKSQSKRPSNKADAPKREKQQSEGSLPPGVIDINELDSGETANGIFELMEGYGFIRCNNYLPGDDDVYIPPTLVRNCGLRTGDIVTGPIRVRNGEKFAALLDVTKINGIPVEESLKRPRFEDLTPIFPEDKIKLERADGKISMRVIDLISPIGKGQRGMIVSPPKAGKTTLIKDIALSIIENHPDMKLIILLIDERPEEVTDIKDHIKGENVEVIYSTFDEQPERHKKVSDMVIARAKRLVEDGLDVCILLDSITRLSRAHNLVVSPSGRTLSGGVDPAALYGPKKFFGAARNMRGGGSLTILATALVETGSRMDEVIFEEFKGTGNMEVVLDRKMSERRIFPAIDILKSSTRRDSKLLTRTEYDIMTKVRKAVSVYKPEDATSELIMLFRTTKTNQEFLELVQKKFNIN